MKTKIDQFNENLEADSINIYSSDNPSRLFKIKRYYDTWCK